MKLVFCGTPEFAVPTLEAVLKAGHEVSLVLTQPDRPAGRKLEMHTPPVKALALTRGLPVQQPERIRHNEQLRRHLEELKPDAILVVAYGRLIPPWMLDLPRFGNLNLHGSLLPKYRGAAPVQWAVANGELETGVSTMRLDSGLDTGEVLLEHRVPIDPVATSQELFPVLANSGAALMVETLRRLEAGTLHGTPQDHAAASLAPILTREDGLMRLDQRTAQQAYNRWRGFTPWPGAFAYFRGKRFLVHSMTPSSVVSELQPNELLPHGDTLFVGAAEASVLELHEVQLEGKPRMAGEAFARGFQLKKGERLA